MGPVSIEPLDLSDLDTLEPLVATLFGHLRELANPVPQVGFRSEDEAWRRRRDYYAECLRDPRSFALLASSDGHAVGYAFVRMDDPLDGWDSDGPLAELESLAVLAEHRGRGIGTALMEAVHERLREQEVRTMLIGVIRTNQDAVRFYERFAYRPWATQLVGRVPGANA